MIQSVAEHCLAIAASVERISFTLEGLLDELTANDNAGFHASAIGVLQNAAADAERLAEKIKRASEALRN